MVQREQQTATAAAGRLQRLHGRTSVESRHEPLLCLDGGAVVVWVLWGQGLADRLRGVPRLDEAPHEGQLGHPLCAFDAPDKAREANLGIVPILAGAGGKLADRVHAARGEVGDVVGVGGPLLDDRDCLPVVNHGLQRRLRLEDLGGHLAGVARGCLLTAVLRDLQGLIGRGGYVVEGDLPRVVLGVDGGETDVGELLHGFVPHIADQERPICALLLHQRTEHGQAADAQLAEDPLLESLREEADV
mmetsp:Transcript_6533/g.14902  ORF Transcript_6533/g.14902 Transcript_6533/m.14902 type:complete len:246 (-) Transcript_6533:99-836(-)